MEHQFSVQSLLIPEFIKGMNGQLFSNTNNHSLGWLCKRSTYRKLVPTFESPEFSADADSVERVGYNARQNAVVRQYMEVQQQCFTCLIGRLCLLKDFERTRDTIHIQTPRCLRKGRKTILKMMLEKIASLHKYLTSYKRCLNLTSIFSQAQLQKSIGNAKEKLSHHQLQLVEVEAVSTL